MKTISLLTLTATWIALTAIGHAQMSTFPAPPALAPSSDQTSNDTTKSPDTTDPVDAAEKKLIDSATGSPSASTNSTTTPAAPSVSASTLTSMDVLDDKVALKAGDTISFRVIEDRDDAVSRVVTDTGEVNFPYINLVKVDGKTCHQVALEVKKLLEVDYYKQATVIIGLDLIIDQDDKKKAQDMAWVVGEVRDIGPQELSDVQPTTVSQLILRAGGFGEFADQRKVKLIHRGSPATGTSPTITSSKDYELIDVKSVFDGKSAADPVVKPGDYVIVPKKFVNI